MKTRFWIALHFTVFVTTGMARGAEPSHPLDPLTWEEHWTALKVLMDADRIDSDSRFTRLSLNPPEKSSVWAWSPGEPFPRAAEVVIKQGERTLEAVVDLDGETVSRWTERSGVQPTFLEEEIDSSLIEEVKADPRFVAALEARGVDHPEYLDCSFLPRGYFGEERFEGRRVAILRCGDMSDVRNTWSRMIEGLVVLVDMNEEEILEIRDDEIIPVPDTVAEYDLTALDDLREFPAPIEVSQPLGAGYETEGNVVKWDRWTFHVRSDHRVGLVISTVTWDDAGVKRPVLYEGHLSELFVPYEAPYENWYVANYLDVGEYSEGGFSASMEPGVHCPHTASFVNAIVTQDNGAPVDRPRVACIFESYAGDVNWVHATEGRPKRQLIVRMAANLDNYDYLFDWIFQTDGSIRISVGATGIVAARMALEANAAEASGKDYSTSRYGAPDRYGHFVDDHIVALNHSHYFNFRLDLDVDGPENSFEVQDFKQVMMPEGHPRRSLWVVEPHIAAREEDAKLSGGHAALWRFIHASELNRHGYPTGYRIVGGMTAHTLLSAEEMPRRRAGFIDHDLWVTPYDADERYAAGDYPTLSKPGEGLPEWTNANRPIAGTDIVAWYTIGMHHVPRAEDWPVMPTLRHEVVLMPFDFFDGNPSLTSDVNP
jgi:primary-amine oxidase